MNGIEGVKALEGVNGAPTHALDKCHARRSAEDGSAADIIPLGERSAPVLNALSAPSASPPAGLSGAEMFEDRRKSLSRMTRRGG